MHHFLTQTATHWQATPERTLQGDVIYTAPEQIKVRWEESRRLILDSKGEETISYARVFNDGSIKEEDYLYFGISVEPSPLRVKHAYKVRSALMCSNLSDTKTLHTVWL